MFCDRGGAVVESRKRGMRMQDRYLFRGKRLDNGEWVYGNLIRSNDSEVGYEAIVIPTNDSNMYAKGEGRGDLGFENWHRVNETTICQCTGYEGIYEKDIFRCEDEDYVIKWSDDSLRWEATSLETDVSVPLGDINPDYMVVIGNEIDNPELLEVQK